MCANKSSKENETAKQNPAIPADESGKHGTLSSETTPSQAQSGTPKDKMPKAKSKATAKPKTPKKASKATPKPKKKATAKPKKEPEQAENPSIVADEMVVELLGMAEALSSKLRSIKGQKLKAGVKEAGLVFDLGAVLAPLQPRFDRETWCTMLQVRRISESMDWRSRKLYEQAKSREAVAGLSINQAYHKFGVHKDPKSRSLDRQLASLAKQLGKIGGDVVDPNRCRLIVEQLKASLDALLADRNGHHEGHPSEG